MPTPKPLSPLLQAAPGVEVFEIEPCFVVLDRIRVDRAVSYEREELTHVQNADGSEDSEWAVKRHYASKKETERANQVYHQAKYQLGRVCTKTEIGFVCPMSKEKELIAAIKSAHEVVEEANGSFEHCRVKFRVVCTRLEPENGNGVEALRDSIKDQTRAIKEALIDFDHKKARTLLRASKGFADMIADPVIRSRIEAVQEEATELAQEMARAVRECGNAASAALTPDGKAVLKRVNAEWNIF